MLLGGWRHNMSKLKSLLQNSKLNEAQNESEEDLTRAFGVGYFVDPSGKLHNLGLGKTHEEWASEHNTNVKDLINRGWTRIRDFGHSSMRYVQGDSNKYDNIWYVIDIAEQSKKNKVIYWVNNNRIELIKSKTGWETSDGRKIGDITESKLRTIPVIAS
jgi:hypothetical protein